VTIRRIVRPLMVALALPLIGGSGAAQTAYNFSPFISANSSLPGDPLLVGLSAERARSVVGVRAGWAVDLAPAGSAVEDGRFGDAWAFDADLTLGFDRVSFLRSVFTTWTPVLFGGLGIEGGRESDGSRAIVPVAAYGFGLGYNFAGPLSVVSEFRRRAPIVGGDPDDGVRKGWDYRLGVALRIGGGRTTSVAPVLASARDRERERSWTAANVPASATAARVLDSADDYLGTRYLWGGDSPQAGFDCSGFVQYVYRRQGVRLPRTSRQMVSAGVPVATNVDALRPGDLLFFAGDYRTIDHVAIYAGGGTIIHSSQSGGGVVLDQLGTRRGRWFNDHLVAARRVLDDGRVLVAGSVDTAAPAGTEFDPPDRAPRRN
jgi:hypothetical protein